MDSKAETCRDTVAVASRCSTRWAAVNAVPNVRDVTVGSLARADAWELDRLLTASSDRSGNG